MRLTNWLEKKRRILALAKQVRSSQGKSLFIQALEIIYLHYSRNKLGLEEYYERGAYHRHRTNKERREFVGSRKEGDYGRSLNHKTWNVVTNDKLTAHAIFSGLNIPHPKIKAIYHPYGREYPGAKSISEPSDLAEYLRSEMEFPFFAKPGHGAGGKGCVACNGYEEAKDSLVLANGTFVRVDDYVAICHPTRGVYPWEAGFIFQELIRPSDEIAELFGPVVPGMRLVVMNPDGPAQIHRAILKIPVANSMTDNFGKTGATGTIVAELNAETGAIIRAQQGAALDITILNRHPQTGADLVGFKIPDWDKYLEVLFRATKAFPGVRLQHWDIAVSNSGPVIYEMNTFGGFGLPQIATGRGFDDNTFREFTAKLVEKYPAYKP